MEFAKTEADLTFLSGTGEVEALNREKMDAGHKWDMIFPFAYAGFIVLLLVQLSNVKRRFVWIGVLFVLLLIIPFDIKEDLGLITIAESINGSISIDVLLLEFI